jgi:predicted restriction endonuclease
LKTSQTEFLQALHTKANQTLDLHHNISLGNKPWLSAGRHSQRWVYVLLKNKVRVELYMNHKERLVNKRVFDALASEKQEIEAEFGEQLNWQRLDNRVASRISIYVSGGLEDEESWSEIIEEAIEKMKKLYDTFGYRLSLIEREKPISDTDEAIDLHEPELPARIEVKTYRILRDTRLARRLKQLHDNQCQICGEYLEVGKNIRYSEAHHIKPLGGEHKGPDTQKNILILCPNHHALCDYNAIKLDKEKLRLVKGHEISDEYIEYHNSRYRKKLHRE